MALSSAESGPAEDVETVSEPDVAAAAVATPVAEARDVFANFGLRRPPAFVEAGRHSQRVRFLRRAIVVVCTSAVGLLIFISLFDPLGKLKGGLSIGSVGIDGTKVTMHDPKLSGVRRDGFAYEVKAATATQDTAAPKLLDLTKLDLKLGQADGSTTRITASTGRYNTEAERLNLSGAVRFFNAGHYEMAMDQAVMDLRDGELSSERRSVVTIPGGRIESDSLLFSEQSRVVSFDGNVHSVFTDDGDASMEEAK